MVMNDRTNSELNARKPSESYPYVPREAPRENNHKQVYFPANERSPGSRENAYAQAQSYTPGRSAYSESAERQEYPNRQS